MYSHSLLDFSALEVVDNNAEVLVIIFVMPNTDGVKVRFFRFALEVQFQFLVQTGTQKHVSRDVGDRNLSSVTRKFNQFLHLVIIPPVERRHVVVAETVKGAHLFDDNFRLARILGQKFDNFDDLTFGINVDYTLFFYKNLVYKNVKASNSPKIKNILRTYKGFKFWEKDFAYYDI